MPSSTRATHKNQPNTPPNSAAAVTPGGEAPEDTEDLEIDAAGIQLLIDFFLQLKKWDKLQSTRTPSKAQESVKEKAA
jgi:hypothetical protein